MSEVYVKPKSCFTTPNLISATSTQFIASYYFQFVLAREIMYYVMLILFVVVCFWFVNTIIRNKQSLFKPMDHGRAEAEARRRVQQSSK
jgi:hypothetical protein